MKDRFRIIGFECIYVFLIIVTSIVYSLIQFAEKKLIGQNSELFFGGKEYRYDPIMYIVGLLLFGFSVWFFHEWVLKKHMEDMVKTGLIFKTVYSLTALFFCFLMFIIQLLENLMILGLDSNIYPEFFAFVTVFGWPAATFIFMMVMMILASMKKKKK